MTLTVEVYSSGSTLLLPDDYRNAQNVRFDGFYPGGLFGTASFFVPREPARLGLIKNGMRVKIRNGSVCVWEGYVSSRAIITDELSAGVQYECIGAWGYLAAGTVINKPWADTRIGPDVWRVEQVSGSLEELFSVSQNNNAIHISPNETLFAADDFAGVRYTMPTGQTIKRYTYNFSFQEDVQNWEMRLWLVSSSAYLDAATTSSTGSVDRTPGTPQSAIAARLYSGGVQTGDLNKHVHGEWTDMVVYSETGAINSTEIGKDIIPLISGCSSAETGIASNTLSLVPFVAEGEKATDTLARAASFGDSSYNSWAFYFEDSDKSPDDKPILYYAQQPALTSAEYYLRLDDANLVAPIALVQDTAEVRNWISVRYQDVSGRTVVLTPDDDATLKDTTSIGLYGTRAEEVFLETTSSTLAANYGRRMLAARKDPQWTVPGGIRVMSYIRNGSNGNVPAANIRPGQRVRIENFIEDLSGTGLTFLITGTAYEDDTLINTLEVGRPNNLDVWLARINF